MMRLDTHQHFWKYNPASGKPKIFVSSAACPSASWHSSSPARIRNSRPRCSVPRAPSRSAAVSLFNFAATALDVMARPWHLAAGQYRLSLATANSAGVSSERGPSRKVTLHERGERIGLTVPSRQLLRLRLVQIKALPPLDPSLPDLALGSDAIELVNPPLKAGKPARLRLTSDR